MRAIELLAMLARHARPMNGMLGWAARRDVLMSRADAYAWTDDRMVAFLFLLFDIGNIGI